MNPTPTYLKCHCSCCAHHSTSIGSDAVTRRQFLYRVGTAAAAGLVWPLTGTAAQPLAPRKPLGSKPLRVQPVLTYDVPERRPHTSWRNWGGIQSEAQATEEKSRISEALNTLKSQAEFGLEILPLQSVRTVDQAAALAKENYDVMLVYAAGGGGDILEKLVTPKRWNLMFLRHNPGPVYLWYEIVHPRFLRKTVDSYGQPGMDVDDVVVDRHEDVLWRLRALHGLKNTLGKRMVAIGGSGGWGEGGQKAPEIARKLWQMDLVDCPYKDLEPRLKRARADAALVSRCEESARRYLREPRVSLHTDRAFITNAFVLTEVMRDLMDEAKTDAITIQHCMGTIMGISETTACLPLSLLNDEGYLAFCESDFVVIPSGVLLHYISGKPVFLNDPTYPHDGVVTLAHCTAPRKMDGRKHERTRIYTHFESDYGAAPKVEMKLGQLCTNLVPDFACKKWVGFEGVIVGNPFLDICRSQVDMKVKGNATALLQEMKGFHWMMCYEDYLKETGYALKKLGVELHNVSAEAKT